MNENVVNEQNAQVENNNAQQSNSIWGTVVKIAIPVATGIIGFAFGHFHGKSKAEKANKNKKNDGFEKAK